MSELAAALHAFVAEHRADGDAALDVHLARVPLELRAAFADAIDAYLAETTRREFADPAYRSSRAPELVASLAACLDALEPPSSG
jgi:hypothetical protein